MRCWTRCLAIDPMSRVACETLVTTGICVVAGEITTKAILDVPKLAREVIADIGFTDAKMGFDAKTCGILNAIQTQSPDIAMGVDTGGAGDQGLMFGYASDETPELMPLPIMLAHKLVRQQSEIRRTGKLTYLRPDGKSQVSAWSTSATSRSASTPWFSPRSMTTMSPPNSSAPM